MFFQLQPDSPGEWDSRTHDDRGLPLVHQQLVNCFVQGPGRCDHKKFLEDVENKDRIEKAWTNRLFVNMIIGWKGFEAPLLKGQTCPFDRFDRTGVGTHHHGWFDRRDAACTCFPGWVFLVSICFNRSILNQKYRCLMIQYFNHCV